MSYQELERRIRVLEVEVAQLREPVNALNRRRSSTNDGNVVLTGDDLADGVECDIVLDVSPKLG